MTKGRPLKASFSASPVFYYYFTLSSDPAVRPMRLLDETRINEILANVIQPMLVSSDQADWESYKKIRAELSNRRLAIVRWRLFGEIECAREHVQFVYQQHGLLQIFEDFCLADTTNCAGGQFSKMIAKFRVTTRAFLFTKRMYAKLPEALRRCASGEEYPVLRVD